MLPLVAIESKVIPMRHCQAPFIFSLLYFACRKDSLLAGEAAVAAGILHLYDFQSV